MDTPVTAFQSYKTMKLNSSVLMKNFIKKKKKRSKKMKARLSKLNKTEMNGHDEGAEGDGGLSNKDALSKTSSIGTFLPKKFLLQNSKLKNELPKKRKSNSKSTSSKKVRFGCEEVPSDTVTNATSSDQKDELSNSAVPDDESSDSEGLESNSSDLEVNRDGNNFEEEQEDTFQIVPSTSDHGSSEKKSKSSKMKEKKEKQDLTIVDSQASGKHAFEWLIAPITVTDFMKTKWENEPVFISRKTPNYYSSLLSTQAIDLMLRNNKILFGKHLDVTSYVNGVRETLNQSGRATPHIIWDYYKNGCSIRLLNPQAYSNNLHTINAMLQEYFGCFVGANVYLTPPDSQGFAPHFDDIEAFILQIEGQKKWKVYKPRTQDEQLPRFSSRNLRGDEIGSPALEVTLKAGDFLYFPRGYIHQACTVPNKHSLHLTISIYQRNSYADLFEKMLPVALKTAVKTNVAFRKGLPLSILNQFGFCHKHEKSEERGKITEKVKKLLHDLVDCLDIDAAVDSIGTAFMHDALPPVLTPDELKCTVDGGLRMTPDGNVVNQVQLENHTHIKLIRLNCCRLVVEEGELDEVSGLREMETRLYYSLENSLEYHGNEPQFLVIPDHMAECVKTLIKSYPKFLAIENIPHSDEDERFQFLRDLWEMGLIRTEEPLPPIVE